MQTGGPIGKEATGVVATQTVYHDSERSSYVVIPVVPARSSPARSSAGAAPASR
jgi:hypothetical protein